jgi:hypothetical protein
MRKTPVINLEHKTLIIMDNPAFVILFFYFLGDTPKKWVYIIVFILSFIVMKLQGTQISQVVLKSLFMLFTSIGFLASCETENNPMLESYIDKQNIIYEAEKRSDLIVWNLDVVNSQFEIPNYGLDPIFLPENAFLLMDKEPSMSLRSHCKQIELQSSEYENISRHLTHYENLQNDILDLAIELQQQAINSLNAYKSSLLDRLNGGTLTQVQYDLLLTNSEGTFILNLRHRYNESRIFTTSSSNLHTVLNDLEKSLSKKSWDRLLSLLKEK